MLLIVEYEMLQHYIFVYVVIFSLKVFSFPMPPSSLLSKKNLVWLAVVSHVVRFLVIQNFTRMFIQG
jgi:hypothetical protein